MTSSGQTICLAMIVRNEAPVIRRCLDSVYPVIDHWIIVDTGSTDETREIVLDRMRDMPGTLHERPWRNFACNRTEALTLARPFGDYTLVIDADDELDLSVDARFPALSADGYEVDIIDGAAVYWRVQVMRNALAWRYEGILHEYPSCAIERTRGRLPIAIRRNHDGARRRDPNTYRADAAILAKALETEKRPILAARYTFYLAQSLFDCGEKEKSLDAYLRRATMGQWNQEVFCALYRAAQLMEVLGHDPDAILATYNRASACCPSRAEAAHGASRLCRHLGRYEQGYALAKPAITLEASAAGLFVESWIYQYGLLDEFAVNAYWAGHYRDCIEAVLRALEGGKVPPGEHRRFVQNAQFALANMT
jgi:glycosyltransferase involved in cell wall biosynthesis